MAGIASKPLTVDVHENGFVSAVNRENQVGPWYTLSDTDKQQVGAPWGPANPQAINRYSSVLNAPTRWTDPGGHYAEYEAVALQGWGYETVRGTDPTAQYVDGQGNKLLRDPDTGVLYRMHNGQKDRLYRIYYKSGEEKYVYESDPDFKDFKSHADAAVSEWRSRDAAIVVGLIAGCAGGAIPSGGIGCPAGAAVGGGATLGAGSGWATYREWQEWNAAIPSYKEIRNVGRPRALPRSKVHDRNNDR